jgi:hypothetical protein
MRNINIKYGAQKLIIVLVWLMVHGILLVLAEGVANIQFFGYIFCLLHIATFLAFILLMKGVNKQYMWELECFIKNNKNVL